MSDTGSCSRLRFQIRSRAVPEDKSAARGKQFYPSASLRDLISKERVLEIISCRCIPCKRIAEPPRRPENPDNLCKHILDTRTYPCLNGNNVLSLFALLVDIQCPQFIAPFLRFLESEEVPETFTEFSETFLKTKVWPRFNDRHPEESSGFAKEFHWEKYRFLVGSVSNAYEEFDNNTILPYINERSLDKGAFGQVYSFDIVEGYRNYLLPRDVHRFARKELRNTIQSRFHAERINLEVIKQLADPHLIAIIKAYKHGEIFNFIFPCARTNLDSYLRDNDFQNPAMFNDRTEQHPFFREMLGLAGALRKIHSCSVSRNQKDYDLYGYHFDIKPANILVMDSGRFVITDFGQANFKQSAGTSRVTGMGGTEAYAPPEIEQRDAKPNRKYDVWSLGCVFLEVYTFVALRYDGVKELDNLKLSKSSDGRREYESFYQQGMVPDTYQLKPSMVRWINTLPQSKYILNDEGRQFLHSMLEVVKQMLEVSITDRWTSQEVWARMDELMSPYKPNTEASLFTGVENFTLPPEEIELGAATLPAISGLSYSIEGHQYVGPVRISESVETGLSMISFQDGQLRRWQLGLRDSIHLFPRYAFPGSSSDGFHGSHMVLASANAQSVSRTLPLQLTLNDIRTVVVVQSLLLGQEVQRSLSLNDVYIDQKSDPLQKLFKRKVKHPTGSLGRAIVQLWFEKPLVGHRRFSSPPTQSSVHKASQQVIEGTNKRRIVIICADTIFAITFSKAIRLKPRDANDDSLSVQVIPTDPKMTRTLTVSRIGFDVTQSKRAIPLDRALLAKQEEEGSFQCQAVKLTFQCHEDLTEFWDTYRSMKESWSAETKQIRTARMVMGETLGRAPT